MCGILTTYQSRRMHGNPGMTPELFFIFCNAGQVLKRQKFSFTQSRAPLL